ncbi:hypothetical protein SCA6_012253 [Theobroma cacao]
MQGNGHVWFVFFTLNLALIWGFRHLVFCVLTPNESPRSQVNKRLGSWKVPNAGYFDSVSGFFSNNVEFVFFEAESYRIEGNVQIWIPVACNSHGSSLKI